MPRRNTEKEPVPLFVDVIMIEGGMVQGADGNPLQDPETGLVWGAYFQKFDPTDKRSRDNPANPEGRAYYIHQSVDYAIEVGIDRAKAEQYKDVRLLYELIYGRKLLLINRSGYQINPNGTYYKPNDLQVNAYYSENFNPEMFENAHYGLAYEMERVLGVDIELMDRQTKKRFTRKFIPWDPTYDVREDPTTGTAVTYKMSNVSKTYKEYGLLTEDDKVMHIADVKKICEFSEDYAKVTYTDRDGNGLHSNVYLKLADLTLWAYIGDQFKQIICHSSPITLVEDENPDYLRNTKITRLMRHFLTTKFQYFRDIRYGGRYYSETPLVKLV